MPKTDLDLTDEIQALDEKDEDLKAIIEEAQAKRALIREAKAVLLKQNKPQTNHNQEHRRTRVSTTREDGRLSRAESYRLVLTAIMEAEHPLDRDEIGRALGYQRSNGTVSRAVTELLASQQIKHAGRNSLNHDTFMYG